MAKTITIKAERLYDGEKVVENAFVTIEGDRIVEVKPGSGGGKADYTGVVCPGFIDAHSHIGMFREGEPQSEAEGNDTSGQIMPLSDPLNSTYFEDQAYKDAVDFGVLYSCIVPGSGNLLGGKARVIRNFVENRKDAMVADYGYKMALGFNPRSTTAWKGERPNTRMGVYQMLERKFDEVIAKRDKSAIASSRKIRELEKSLAEGKITETESKIERKSIELESALDLSSEEKAIADILSGRPTVKVHVHKEDDVLYLIDLVKKYKFKATADHLGDVHHKEIFDELARAGIPIVYGPLGSPSYKVELKNDRYQNTALLMKSKAKYGLMTDHPVILSYQLRDSLKYFLIHGMSDVDAINLITRKNAEILGIDADLGSVAAGKLASLVVWDRDPLSLGAFPKMVMAEGKVVRKR